jgi:hypothetical protein
MASIMDRKVVRQSSKGKEHFTGTKEISTMGSGSRVNSKELVSLYSASVAMSRVNFRWGDWMDSPRLHYSTECNT